MKRSVCQAIASVAKKIPDPLTRQEILEIEPSIAHITEVAINLTDWLTDDNLGWPFRGLGQFYGSQGSYSLAELWLERRERLSGD